MAPLTLAVALLAPAIASAQIANSPHDFSGAGYGSTQVCVFCHAPHNVTNQIVPLWNHATTTAQFTLYSSSSLNAVPGQPSGNSRACLSCHDGTVAIDSYGGRTGGTALTSGSRLIGTDISNDHPVSFTYDAALATADGSLVTPASANAVVAGIPLYGAALQCASCHNVHSNANTMFLRVNNAGSNLCMQCHTK